MAASSRPDRRRRVARGIYEQPNGRVCRLRDGRRTAALSHARCDDGRRGPEAARTAPEHARSGELPVSPRLTFAEVAAPLARRFRGEGHQRASGAIGRSISTARSCAATCCPGSVAAGWR